MVIIGSPNGGSMQVARTFYDDNKNPIQIPEMSSYLEPDSKFKGRSSQINAAYSEHVTV